MKVRVEISDYIKGRYNLAKLEKLKTELEKIFLAERQYPSQIYPEDGVLVEISMSAKYQNLYIKVSEWGEYQSVGQLEDVVKEAIENRGFELVELYGDEESFKITFE